MDNQNNPQQQPQSTPEPTPQNYTPINPSPAVSTTPIFSEEKKSRKKPLIILLILVLLIGGAGAYFLTKSKPQPATGKKQSPQSTLLSAKPQFFEGDSVAGYITYDPVKFKEVTKSNLPQIQPTDPNVNAVIVQANIVSFSDSGLYLYDLKTNKTFRLTDGGGSPRIMSDHFLLYGFDTGSGKDKQLGGKLLNLKTGETKTVFTGAPEAVPGTVCCSVSPDGFKAAFVQKDKISIWDIRTGKTTDYTATVNPIDPHFSRTSANDYAVEMSYAAPVWLDNNTIVYADKPAASQVVANQPAQIVDDKVYELNTQSGTSTALKGVSGGVYNLYASGGSIFMDQNPLDQAYTQISLLENDSARPLGINPGWAMISPDGDKVYFFGTLDSQNNYSVVDVNASDPNVAPAAFDPHIPGVSVTQVLPRGWAGPDRMILAETNTANVKNHEYIVIFNVATNKVEQYLQVN